MTEKPWELPAMSRARRQPSTDAPEPEVRVAPKAAEDRALKDDEAVLAELIEQHRIGCSPAALAHLERRRIRDHELDSLCASLEAVGVPGEGLRRKLYLLTVERDRPALPPLVIAILQTEDGDPPEQRYVLRLMGELEGEDER